MTGKGPLTAGRGAPDSRRGPGRRARLFGFLYVTSLVALGIAASRVPAQALRAQYPRLVVSQDLQLVEQSPQVVLVWVKPRAAASPGVRQAPPVVLKKGEAVAVLDRRVIRAFLTRDVWIQVRSQRASGASVTGWAYYGPEGKQSPNFSEQQ